MDTARPASAFVDAIPGWFFPVDQDLFEWFLGRAEAPPGDLLEIGVYLGKSAVFVGAHLRPGERFTVCDLFDGPAPDEATSAEIETYYQSVSRQRFELNYLGWHRELPMVVEGPSSMVTAHVRPRSCRFAHVDASHLYRHVRGDILAARELLVPDGVVALDDYRSPHTPGVAAATWEAVVNCGLKPVAISENKFYGTWGDAEGIRAALRNWLAGTGRFWTGVDEVAGQELLRVVKV